jgi:ribosomal protein L11
VAKHRASVAQTKVGVDVAIHIHALRALGVVDLNCFELDSAMKMVAGTARSMGITVKGTFPGIN